MADLNNLPERGVPGTHLSVRHSPDAVAALRASIARQNLTIDVDATTGDVVLYLSAAKTTYITFSAATGATKLVVAGVDRGSIESGLMGDKDPQESVLSRYDPTPNLPVTPTEGDRYLATATANTWTKDYIYTLNGASAWDEYVPDEGALVEVEDENVWYTFTGAAWIRFEEQIAHALLAGLQGGTTSEYFHLTEAQHAAFYLGQTGVLGRFDPTAALPVAPSDWDAYLATATANGWTDGNCYVWNGAAWIVVVVAEGQKLWVADEDLIYAYDGATWGILQAKDAGGHDHGAATGAGATHTHAITDPNHDHGAATAAGATHTHAITDPNHDHGAATGSDGAATIPMSLRGSMPTPSQPFIGGPFAVIPSTPNPGGAAWMEYNTAIEPDLAINWTESNNGVNGVLTLDGAGPNIILTDAMWGGFTAAMVGKYVYIQNDATVPGNNGLYGRIASYTSPTAVVLDVGTGSFGALAVSAGTVDFLVYEFKCGDCTISYRNLNTLLGNDETRVITQEEIEDACVADEIAEGWMSPNMPKCAIPIERAVVYVAEITFEFVATADAEVFDLYTGADSGFAMIHGCAFVHQFIDLAGGQNVILGTTTIYAVEGLVRPSAPVGVAGDIQATCFLPLPDHTHAIAADATGVTADAEATHTHAIAADATGVTADAEATHTHSITAAGDHAHDVGV